MPKEITEPLVSCIMPTYNRRVFVPHAIRYFLRQDYINKELIIIDDGPDSIADLVPEVEGIHYFRLEKKISLGAKLNMACRYAKGSFIVNWDDDDWYAPGRLSYQVNAMKNKGIYICGLNKLLYYDLRKKNAYQYIYPADQRTWLLGSSLCYTREFWNANPFEDIDVGMDGLFVWKTTSEHINVLDDPTFAVHMIHEHNVSPKRTDGEWWHHYPVKEIEKIVDGDWRFYKEGKIISPDKLLLAEKFSHNGKQIQSRAVSNIYACLVHENEDCIIDLLRNLHYHDPASVILLYNGSENRELLASWFPYDKFNVRICPNSLPVKWGYLHNFALHCMEYALQHLSFDTITIVDSDQLCIRSGYRDYLGSFLHDNKNVGMLSSMPGKVDRVKSANHVAARAYMEYDLWKPFLQKFPNGDTAFVHWTFWPSTVFTFNAVKDLVTIFREDPMLKHIMEQSKIWATEEVILPTMVKLLGYEIENNPCSYDYVNYKRSYTSMDIEQAFEKTSAYWVHPVARAIDNPVRKVIREQFNNYSRENKVDAPLNGKTFSFQGKAELISTVRKIEGWLSDNEADLLVTITLNVLTAFPFSNSIVEIGSYHGKSTVLFGTIVKKCSSNTKVYAIDRHDGKLGAADQGLKTYPPSFEKFRKNIVDAEITDIVEVIKESAVNVIWQRPISLLFIDGLHDYDNVAADFHHFSIWISPGGFVAFHDYANYFPGVKQLVDEILQAGIYRKIQQIDSLIILQKLYEPN